MLKKVQKKSEIIFILKNLRNEDKQEVIALYGNLWKKKILNESFNKDCLIVYGFDKNGNKIPIAMGGFYEPFKENKTIACVWLLSTCFISENKILFVKILKNQILKADKKYKIMFNFIYKTNFEAKKWLKKLGFKFDNPKPKGMIVKENFEFFYKVNER
jgi:hypothetical protein